MLRSGDCGQRLQQPGESAGKAVPMLSGVGGSGSTLATDIRSCSTSCSVPGLGLCPGGQWRTRQARLLPWGCCPRQMVKNKIRLKSAMHTRRYHFIHYDDEKKIKQNTGNNRCCGGCGEIGTLMQC